MKRIFIIYESRYDGLSSLLKDDNYSEKTMGEILWFSSLIKYLLTLRNVRVIHCRKEINFVHYLNKLRNHNPFLIMDYMTIPKSLNYIDFNNTYCMCYWGRRNEKDIKELGTKNNKTFPYKNILTPFNYDNFNTFLGYNLDIICPKFNYQKYKKDYGILWGKDKEFINLKLVKKLIDKGIKFYSTSKTKLNIPGIVDLGILPKREWSLLLHNCKFILGSGKPSSGPTILEALYYKTLLFCPKRQIPKTCKDNQNIHLIDKLEIDKLYNKIKTTKFKNDEKTKFLCDSKFFEKRVKNIFSL